MANCNGKGWLKRIVTGLLIAAGIGIGSITKAKWDQVGANTSAIAVQDAQLKALKETVDRIDRNVTRLVEQLK